MIEIMRFRLRRDVDASGFLEIDSRLQTDFAYRQPGLLRRTTGRGEENEWVVIDLWRSHSAADESAQRWEHDAVARAFMGLVDRETLQVSRYDELDAAPR